MNRSNIKELIDKIHKLPPLKLVVQKLLLIANDDSSSAAEITKILSSDQAIAGKVLELVNSSFYGYTRKITTISRAVVILGNKAIQSLALAFASIDAFKDFKGIIAKDKFWQHSISTAIASQILAAETQYEEPEEAFVAGLLHDMGQLLLGSFFPDEYKQVLEMKGDIIKNENHVLRFTHTEAASILLEHWQLPPLLCEVVKKHHMNSLMLDTDNTLLRIIGAAEIITKINENTLIDYPRTGFDYQIIKALGIQEFKYKQILLEIDRAMTITEQILNIPVPKNNSNKQNHYEHKICILGSNHCRIEWVKSLVDYMGYTPASSAIDKVIASEEQQYQLCIIDPSAIPDETILKIILHMGKVKTKVAFLSTAGYHEEKEHKQIKGFIELPYSFSKYQLEEALGDHKI